MQPTKTKTLFAPHMAPLAAIALIVKSGLTSNNQFKDAVAISTSIPLMNLKPEHVTEVTAGIEKQIDELQDDKKHQKALVNQLINHLVNASQKLVTNNHQKQNHTGDITGAQPKPEFKQGAGAQAQ